MSTQKGNSNRSRPQKYQNQIAFKNDLHDKSNKTKCINSIQVTNVCERCKKIIEWKIKYKKYKPLKTAAKCIKCEQKTIKHAYHNICLTCAAQYNVCPKCGNEDNIVKEEFNKTEIIKLDTQLQNLLKRLPERKRRTFMRYINSINKEDKSNNTIKNEEEDINKEKEKKNTNNCISKEDLLLKLKSLIIKEDNDDFDINNKFDSDSE
ncbi:uncharacterized protein C9orf85 homolog [Apis mellifera]|uniref:Uncharacterized protein C9orf85 homolog n=1 Tax=Apis mellifera TaxID=7460 RepID=A0A7M7G900_APIME|nr:uncharacterized protein C9orf85 homolog [Apis mellifera]|eukprot:XP_001122855.3 uncharacterized protein C9orf85 homolog [Apis mellifera]